MKRKPIVLILLVLGLCGLLMGIAVLGYQDMQVISAPGNPSAGYIRCFATGAIYKCLTSSGASAIDATSINGAAIPSNCAMTNTNGTPVFQCQTAKGLASVAYVAGAGTGNAQTATYSPAVAALADIRGYPICWLPTAANSTTTPTLAVNGLTATTITKYGAGALVANDIVSTAVACAIYDGTDFELQNPQTLAPGTGTVTSVATTSPIGGGTITTSGTITCTTCTITVGNGTITFNPGAIASGACSSASTVTISGTATTDNVAVDFNADPTGTTGYLPGAMITIVKYPTSNTVNVKGCNNTGSSITPSSVTLNARVTR